MRGPLVVEGVLAILAGLVAFAVPLAASVSTATFIGIVLLCAAFPIAFEGFAGPHALGGRVLRLLLALVTLAAGLYLLVANGAVSLVLGLLIAEELPESSDWAIGLLVGFDLLFFGGCALWLARSLGSEEEAGPAPVL
jgi:uncharacterized membrane protein HdeD (DUF308 family)